MIELSQLQQHFFTRVIADNELAKQSDAFLEPYIVPKNQFSASQQLQIYRDSIFGSLVTALSQIYPVIKKVLGDDFFDAMACRYLQKEHSQSPDLGDYGLSFPTFIASFSPAKDLVYLSDLAQLEWFWHRAFHGQDDQALNLPVLTQLSEEQQSQILFRLPYGATLLTSDFAIEKIWQFNQDDYQGESEISLDHDNHYLIIWRSGFEMRIDSLSKEQWQLLTLLNKKQTFEQSFQENENVTNPVDISLLMPQLVSNGWITADLN